MVYLRKGRAGSCNLGYTWPDDGSVVEVTDGHAASLLAIPYNDFTAVPAPGDEPATAGPEAEAPELIEEPAPEAAISEAPAPRKAPAKGTAAAAKKADATAAKTAVEEQP